MNTKTLLLSAGLALGMLGSAQAQTLKIATIAPEGSAWMEDMRAGASEIGQRTGGRVNVKFYGGGVQGNDKQVQRKMRTGQLNGGAFTSGGMAQFQKDARLYDMPLAFNNVEEVQYVRAELDAVLRQRLEDAGYVNFGFAGGGFAYMMSNQPLASLKDLEGQKVWTPEGDPVAYAALSALGVAPVTMPLTDVMTGLQTDLLNSVTVPPVGAVVLQWHTRLKFITELPVAYVYAGILIDKKAFGRLSPADQAVVREVFEAVYQKFDANGIVDNEKAMQALLDSGLQRVAPVASQVTTWREKVAESNLKQAQSGAVDLELLMRLRGLLQEYRNSVETTTAATSY